MKKPKQSKTFAPLHKPGNRKIMEAWFQYHKEHAPSSLRKMFKAFMIEWNAKR